jgi:hypothetical protein
MRLLLLGLFAPFRLSARAASRWAGPYIGRREAAADANPLRAGRSLVSTTALLGAGILFAAGGLMALAGEPWLVALLGGGGTVAGVVAALAWPRG